LQSNGLTVDYVVDLLCNNLLYNKSTTNRSRSNGVWAMLIVDGENETTWVKCTECEFTGTRVDSEKY